MIKSIDNTIKQLEEQYGEKYLLKEELLERVLTTEETGINKIKVIGFEAGLGKSQLTNIITANYIREGGERKFLLVKKFQDEVLQTFEIINHVCQEDVALGLISDNWNKFRDDYKSITNARALIITHQRYKDLCLDDNLRRIFSIKRNTLVIDESLQTPICTFSEAEYKEIQHILPASLDSLLAEICAGLLKQVRFQANNATNNLIAQCNPQIDASAFLVLKNKLKESLGAVKKNNEILRFINSLERLYNQPCLYNNGTISCQDARIYFWTLQNNLILDANAQIDLRYKYAPNIKVLQQQNIKDYSNSILYQIPINSSRSGIKKFKNFHEQLSKLIVEKQTSETKTLIVAHKKDFKIFIKILNELGINKIGILDDYDGEDVAIAYFGAIVGKNHWRDFNQIFITATQLYPMETYVHEYFYHSQELLTTESLQMLSNKKERIYGFNEEKFEDVRFGLIVSELYQAIGRINRNGTAATKIFVVNSYNKIITELQKHLTNIHLGDSIELDIQYKRS